MHLVGIMVFHLIFMLCHPKFMNNFSILHPLINWPCVLLEIKPMNGGSTRISLSLVPTLGKSFIGSTF
jgi:hypothetical protein